MKKVVSIVVVALYVASIAIVGFFGMKIVNYNPTVYPISVECINEDIVVASDGKKFITVRVGEDYQIKWIVLPENSTDKSVTFIYSSSGSNPNTVTDEGLVTFNTRGDFSVEIRTSNSSAKREIIYFDVLKRA